MARIRVPRQSSPPLPLPGFPGSKVVALGQAAAGSMQVPARADHVHEGVVTGGGGGATPFWNACYVTHETMPFDPVGGGQVLELGANWVEQASTGVDWLSPPGILTAGSPGAGPVYPLAGFYHVRNSYTITVANPAAHPVRFAVTRPDYDGAGVHSDLSLAYTDPIQNSGESVTIQVSAWLHMDAGAVGFSRYVNRLDGFGQAGSFTVECDVQFAYMGELGGGGGGGVETTHRLLARQANNIVGFVGGAIGFDTIDEDPDGAWDAANKWWSVPVDGVYEVEATVFVTNPPSGSASIDVVLGSTDAYDTRHVDPARADKDLNPRVNVTTSPTYTPLVTGDHIYVVLQNLGGATTVQGFEYATYLRIKYLGPL